MGVRGARGWKGRDRETIDHVGKPFNPHGRTCTALTHIHRESSERESCTGRHTMVSRTRSPCIRTRVKRTTRGGGRKGKHKRFHTRNFIHDYGTLVGVRSARTRPNAQSHRIREYARSTPPFLSPSFSLSTFSRSFATWTMHSVVVSSPRVKNHYEGRWKQVAEREGTGDIVVKR